MAGEFSLAGTKFTIGGTAITGLLSFPDMGTTPAKIKVTSFDDTVNERYINGLKDTSDFTFEFNMDGNNFAQANSATSDEEKEYVLTLPDGSSFTWTGTHTAFLSGGSVGNNAKFKISCTVNSEISYSAGV